MTLTYTRILSYPVLDCKVKKKDFFSYHGKVPKMYNVPAHQFVLVIFFLNAQQSLASLHNEEKFKMR